MLKVFYKKLQQSFAFFIVQGFSRCQNQEDALSVPYIFFLGVLFSWMVSRYYGLLEKEAGFLHRASKT
jgi:hypothetical protein